MWRKLFGGLSGQFGFYDLFNRHAATTLEAAKCLLELCDEFPTIKGKVARIEELEHECDSITHMTVDLLHHTFITPLDRDEILNLISKLDDVMDYIDRASKTMLFFELDSVPGKLKDMIKVLNRALEAINEAVKLIPGFKYGDKLREIHKEIHRLENEGDGFHHAGIIELFHDNVDKPLVVIKNKEIYETIEEAIDTCEDIADIIENIVLEHF
jgi:uncharacterized protein